MSDVESEVEVPVSQLRDVNVQRNQSLLEGLRQKNRDLQNKETYINIPGYDDAPPIMKAKYRLLEGKEIDDIMTKVMKEVKGNWDRQVLSAVDMFIAACEGMFVDIGDGAEEPYQMKTNEGTEILGYNPDLAAALELQGTETARQVVFAVFANNEAAIMQHNVKLSLWMSNTSRKVDDDFLGIQ